jgi:Tfp pilus assembly protein PilP
MTRLFLIAGLLVAGVWPAAAQTPGAAPGAPEPQSSAPAAPTTPAPPTPPANFAYGLEGRRDPFVPLLGNTAKKGMANEAALRGEGLAGLITEEISVKGIMLSQGTWVAMVSGPSNKVFTARPGDRLADGTIRSITPQFLVILQQVNDPLSLEKQREVRKFLRGGETK